MRTGKVRIGLIGLGQRGMATLRRYEHVEGAEIVAVADLQKSRVEQACQILQQRGAILPATYVGPQQWETLCTDASVSLVYVCTDWASHAPIAVYAMLHGKHVALEVPAATSIQECWQLVRVSKQTGRHCTMLENCCYDIFHLGIMGMLKKGIFGQVVHAEGAYIHDLRADQGWMAYSVHGHGGNPYPTHGIGPACQLLGIPHSDRLKNLTSMTSRNGLNNTLLRTELGSTILLQFDECTPRPYSRIQTLCGTSGYAQKYPVPTLQIDGQEILSGKEAEQKIYAHWDDTTRHLVAQGQKRGVENLMNYMMDCRLISALQNGLAPDISVADSALWSSIAELSARSAHQGGVPIDIPDFYEV